MSGRNHIKVAFVGNPNSGKSSLFNGLTGLNQKVANFPGVTVDKKTGECSITSSSGTYDATIIDLPGTYSLYARSLDERISYEVLCEPLNGLHPDITVVIADASNLKRSLFLCTQVVDLQRPVVLALNMMDIVESRGQAINIKELTNTLGIEVVFINARKREGIDRLKEAIIRNLNVAPKMPFLEVREYAEEAILTCRAEKNFESDYAAFQFLNLMEVQQTLNFDSKKLQARETLERYQKITGIVQKVLVQEKVLDRKSVTDSLDRILTHRVWGIGLFMLVMFLMFQAVFSWSAYPMALIESGFVHLSLWVKSVLPSGIMTDLLVNGILAGLSGIAVFVPQIALLFTFISILEDSGYMARVSFITDRLMRSFGLNGKSVIPLISGVACAVPAIMSARTIQNWKERIITIMVTPLMSCSARIPVYTLLISLVIPPHYVWGFISLQGLALMSLYLIGFFASIGSALVMKLLIRSKERSYFIMEMPLYRMPRWGNIGLTIVEKVKVFLFDAGKVIIAISIILWALSSYGPGDNMRKIEEKYGKNQKIYAEGTAVSNAGLNQKIQSEKLGESYAGVLGRFIEPAIKPLGFDWKIGIALVTSFAAREVFVGTMSTIYSVGEDNGTSLSVKEKMAEAKDPETGKPLYTFAVGLSLMLFYAFAMQCMSTLAVVKRETKSWKWPMIQLFYMTGLAYVSSFVVFQIFK